LFRHATIVQQNLIMISTFGFIILGLITGVVTGVTGASGVLIIVPILTSFVDLPLKTVLGTSLLVDVIVSISVSYAYARRGYVDIKSSAWILVGALLGAQAGSFVVAGVPKIFITVVLMVCMIFFGVNMWRSGVSRRPYTIITLPEHLAERLRRPLAMVLVGVLIGLATGVFGAGGGLAIFIALFSLLRLPVKTAVGTSTFLMLLTALSGVAGYIRYESLNWEIGLIIGIAAAVGGAASSWVADRVPDELLSRIIGAFFVFLALIMLALKVIMPLVF